MKGLAAIFLCRVTPDSGDFSKKPIRNSYGSGFFWSMGMVPPLEVCGISDELRRWTFFLKLFSQLSHFQNFWADTNGRSDVEMKGVVKPCR